MYDKLCYVIKRWREVNQKNTESFNRMKKAERRDDYYINKLIPEVKKIDDDKLKIITDFWKPYEFAYKNNPMTQAVFYNQSGVFDPSYVGFGQQIHSLVRFWNNETFSTFRNKNFSRLLFPFLKHPVCYVSCSYGNYFDENHNILSKDQAIDKIMEILKEKKELVLKPCLDSGSGSSIIFISETDTKETITKHVNTLQPDFVCQEILKNHDSFKTGCNALNTIRVCTLFYKNKVKFVGSVFRMSAGKRIDNWDAGGILCQVDRNGELCHFATDGRGKVYYKHPNGFEFSGHKLFKAVDVFNAAIECHKRIPQQKYISWDFTVNENGQIVFLEMNSPDGSELLQSVGINAYINQDVAKEIFDDYIYVLKSTFDWDYRECAHYVMLLKYAGMKKTVSIPKTFNGKPVKLVLMNAFKDRNVKKIILPKSVKMNTTLIRKDNVQIEFTE